MLNVNKQREMLIYELERLQFAAELDRSIQICYVTHNQSLVSKIIQKDSLIKRQTSER